MKLKSFIKLFVWRLINDEENERDQHYQNEHTSEEDEIIKSEIDVTNGSNFYEEASMTSTPLVNSKAEASNEHATDEETRTKIPENIEPEIIPVNSACDRLAASAHQEICIFVYVVC